MTANAILAEAATRAGLQRRADSGDAAFGTRHGFAVQLSATKHEGSDCILFVTRVQDDSVGLIRDKVSKDPRVVAAKIKLSALHVEGDVVSYGFVRPSFGKIEAGQVVDGIDAILGAITDVTPPPPAVCRSCGTDVGASPMLLNGIVDRICDPCIAKLKAAAAEGASQYDRIKLRVVRGLAAAAGLSLLGGAVWAGVAIAFDLQFWLLAIGIGWVIGYGTIRAAGKGGLFVQILSALSGLASPLLGIVFAALYVAAKQDPTIGAVELVVMFVLSPLILLEMGTTSLFAAAAGLIGGAIAASMAKKPTFALTVVR